MFLSLAHFRRNQWLPEYSVIIRHDTDKRRANEVRSKNNGCDKSKTGYSRYTASINILSPLISSSSRFLFVDSFMEVPLIEFFEWK
ncbi:hypothetical protein CDAR_250141 [Caerostris darwini]|uniref:Ycf15 n=1 Tax=Caerostris darwini TaxID=1538125 RepID=A0AAV4REA5_9ARAC|nr:hypothetical protein CDAR_250141 [Caerostris darwini]